MLTPSQLRPGRDMKKANKMSFLNRKKGLKNKLHELTTLCDIEAGLILFDPKQTKPETWARNPMEFDKIVSRFRGLSVEQRKKSSQNLMDVLKEKKKSLEAEFAKLRDKNLEAEFPTWEPALDSFSEEQLREVLCSLDSHIEIVKKKFEDGLAIVECPRASDQESPSCLHVVALAPLNSLPPVQCSYPSNSQQDQRFEVLNSIMSNTNMMNKNDFLNFDYGPCLGESNCSNHCQPYVLPDQGNSCSNNFINAHDPWSQDHSINGNQFCKMNSYRYSIGGTTTTSPTDNDDWTAGFSTAAAAQFPVMTMNDSDYTYSMKGSTTTSPHNYDSWQHDQIVREQFPMTTINGSDISYWMGGSDITSLPDEDFGPSDLSVVTDHFPLLTVNGFDYGNPNY